MFEFCVKYLIKSHRIKKYVYHWNLFDKTIQIINN